MQNVQVQWNEESKGRPLHLVRKAEDSQDPFKGEVEVDDIIRISSEANFDRWQDLGGSNTGNSHDSVLLIR
jgi:hypothetical protein